MGAEQHVMSLPRYTFEHGADFEVKFAQYKDAPNCIKDVFVVRPARGGYTVRFEMMRLLQGEKYKGKPPRDWGFGDIFDGLTNARVWNFGLFTTSPPSALSRIRGFKGDMVTVCGEDNRTYVECRARDKDKTVLHSFLLVELLPRWNVVASLPVPPLPIPVVDVPDVPDVPEVLLELPPEVPEVVVPTPPPVTEPVAVKVVPPTEVDNENALIRADLAKVQDHRNYYMREFVTGAFARMLRPSKYLK